MICDLNHLTFRKPDNGHCHFRHKGDPRFAPTVRYIASQFARANAMGNLPSPILTARQMHEYEMDIRTEAVRCGYPKFQPLMVTMISPDTTPDMIEAALLSGAYGIKVMPAHGTTNSSHGISDYAAPQFIDCLKVIAEHKKALLVHAELPFEDGKSIPVALRSKKFIPTLDQIREAVPELRICVEHIDAKELVAWVVDGGENVSATVTPHHLEVTAEQADADPHLQCMPYPKSEEDIQSIRHVIFSNRHRRRFFYGSDNAPHLLSAKLANPPASGVFTAPTEIPVIVELFYKAHATEFVEGFMSEFFADWHGLPRNEGTVTVVRDFWQVPEQIDLGGSFIVPYKHGETLYWRMA